MLLCVGRVGRGSVHSRGEGGSRGGHPATAALSAAARSLLLWLLDLMSQVAVHEDTNRMSAKNMAVVMVSGTAVVMLIK